MISLNESVTVPYGSLSNCRKTRETSSLEPDLLEYKFYCPAVGLVLTIDAATGETLGGHRKETVRGSRTDGRHGRGARKPYIDEVNPTLG